MPDRFLLAGALMALCCASPAQRQHTPYGTTGVPHDITGQVVQIVSGDSIILRCQNRRVAMRLWGLKATSVKERVGLQAKRALEDLILEAWVDVKWMKGDQAAGTVLLPMTCETKPTGDGHSRIDVNLMLVWYGCARWNRAEAPHADHLQRAEQWARKKKLGIWAPK